uniref:DUF4939 domain-containing protein n=1 Tax=Nothobranchius furzeri TaxID=105023 RepID=A0A8C6NHU2_NOTFU
MTESTGHKSTSMEESLPPAVASTLAKHEKTIETVLSQLSATNQRLFQLDSALRQMNEAIRISPPSTASPPTVTSAVPSQSSLPVPPPGFGFRVVESPLPETFSGEPGTCRNFLLLCQLAFNRSPDTFCNDSVKISYMVGLFRGKALQWDEAKSRQPDFLHGPLSDFLTEFKQLFDSTESPAELPKHIWNLQQGKKSLSEFAIEFRTLASVSTLDEALEDRIYRCLESVLSITLPPLSTLSRQRSQEPTTRTPQSDGGSPRVS